MCENATARIYRHQVDNCGDVTDTEYLCDGRVHLLHTTHIVDSRVRQDYTITGDCDGSCIKTALLPPDTVSAIQKYLLEKVPDG